MHEPKGSTLPITGPRRFVIDLVHFAKRVPSTPVSRLVNVSALFGPAMSTRPAHRGRCFS